MALGNHTWSHPDLTTLADQEVAEEIRRNREFLRSTFGVADSPFLRPPFGAHDERIDRIAADLGHPTIAMWNGTLDDSRVLTRRRAAGGRPEVVHRADDRRRARQPPDGHHRVRRAAGDLIAERGLTTVTLADVWATPAQRLRGAAVHSLSVVSG